MTELVPKIPSVDFSLKYDQRSSEPTKVDEGLIKDINADYQRISIREIA